MNSFNCSTSARQVENLLTLMSKKSWVERQPNNQLRPSPKKRKSRGLHQLPRIKNLSHVSPSKPQRKQWRRSLKEWSLRNNKPLWSRKSQRRNKNTARRSRNSWRRAKKKLKKKKKKRNNRNSRTARIKSHWAEWARTRRTKEEREQRS